MLSDRGSALMLMPAAVLIVLVLAAIAMDLSLLHLARRELIAAAEAAANDAVTFGLDEARYRRGDGYQLDPARARRAVVQALVARGLADDLTQPPRVVVAATTVEVSLAMRVDFVFARALPGLDHHATVSATGLAAAIER
jgi:hypothetical protein